MLTTHLLKWTLFGSVGIALIGGRAGLFYPWLSPLSLAVPLIFGFLFLFSTLRSSDEAYGSGKAKLVARSGVATLAACLLALGLTRLPIPVIGIYWQEILVPSQTLFLCLVAGLVGAALVYPTAGIVARMADSDAGADLGMGIGSIVGGLVLGAIVIGLAQVTPVIAIGAGLAAALLILKGLFFVGSAFFGLLSRQTK